MHIYIQISFNIISIYIAFPPPLVPLLLLSLPQGQFPFHFPLFSALIVCKKLLGRSHGQFSFHLIEFPASNVLQKFLSLPQGQSHSHTSSFLSTIVLHLLFHAPPGTIPHSPFFFPSSDCPSQAYFPPPTDNSRSYLLFPIFPLLTPQKHFPFSPRKNTLTLPVLPDIIVLENSLRALVPTAMLWNSGRSFYDPGSCLETGWPSHFEKEATHTFADEVREIIWFFIVRCFKKTDIFLRTLHQFSHSARIRASILIFRRNQDEKKNNRIVTFS